MLISQFIGCHWQFIQQALYGFVCIASFAADMTAPLPIYISLAFLILFFLFVAACFRLISSVGFERNTAIQKTKSLVLLWLLVQAALAAYGFYEITDSIPPRMSLAVLPPILFLVLIMAYRPSRKWLGQLPLCGLTGIQFVRLPLEIILYHLWLDAWIPREMTFHGSNPDIFMGITAPFAAWAALRYAEKLRWVLFTWHLLGVILVLNIVIISIKAAPGPLQQIAFNQPNKAVLYFPLIWLPSLLVPIVILSHLIALRQLWYSGKR